MKVNFWQVLGIILIVLAVVFFRPKKTGPQQSPTTPAPAATQPAPTQPAP